MDREALIEFLRDNLRISLRESQGSFSESSRVEITATLSIGDDEISSDYISIDISQYV